MSLRSLETSVPVTDLDPPGYAHPSVPPPPTADAAPGWGARWGRTCFLVGFLCVVGVDVVGNRPWERLIADAYQVAARPADAVIGRTRARASAAAAASNRPSRIAHLDRMFRAFPEELTRDTCPDSEERTPLVLYASIETLLGTEPRPAGLILGTVPAASGRLTTAARRIAVLRTSKIAQPGAAMPGSYEGRLVVFDASTSAPICGTIIHASSSSSPAALSAAVGRENFGALVRSAVADGGSRLHVTLDL